MSKLMVSVSGIRGIVGETLTPDVITGFTHAFIKIVGKGTIYVGRDPRGSGEMVENLVVGTLLSIGCKVISLGIVPTPTVEIMVANNDAKGGIIITASHNPPQWNALKFINNQGMFLEKPLVNELSQYFDSEARIPPVAWDQVSLSQFDNTAVAFHKNRILTLPFIDVKAIQKRHFKVSLDCNHGVASVMGRSFLEDLGCDVVALGETPDGKFEHPCEPIPENLGMLCQSVLQEKADIGFAIDPDGDRVAIVSEQGKAIGEEFTLAIGTKCILSRKKGPITLNLSTSRMAEDIAKSYGCQCFRTAVGEINVSSEMKRNGSVVGGEGNGGVMIPEVQCCRDAFGGMALCLQFLVDRKESISKAISSLPAFIMRKETVPIGTMNADELLEKVLKKFSDAKVDRQDGLHFSWADCWIHVRKSNTEPILRIIAEGKTSERIAGLISSVRALIPENKPMPRISRAEALVIDIDGTLTPPRELLRKEMADALSKLRVPFFVAAGSDLPLVKNQFFDPLKKFRFRGCIEAFLNNGASQYRFDCSKGCSISVIKKFDIQKHLGSRDFAAFLNVLKDTLHKKEFKLPASVKITGEQIIDRGSMVNFAPIGRPPHAKLTKTDLANRKNFVKFDKAHHYRDDVIAYLESRLSDVIREKNLKIMYGGQTSFDIVIKGMDKTHPIKILLDRGYQRVVFLGDALFKGGNDSVIMDFIGEWKNPMPCPVVAVRVEHWQNTIDQFRANCWLDA